MCCTSAAMSRKIQLTVEYEFHNNNAEVFTLCRDELCGVLVQICFVFVVYVVGHGSQVPLLREQDRGDNSE